MALDFKVTSPTSPGLSGVTGGTITTTDNGDGTWQLTSSDTITYFRFDTNKTDITAVEVISEDLTALGLTMNNNEGSFRFYGIILI